MSKNSWMILWKFYVTASIGLRSIIHSFNGSKNWHMKFILNVAFKNWKNWRNKVSKKIINFLNILRFSFLKGMIGIGLCIYETAANMYFIKIKGLTCLAYSRRTTSVRKKDGWTRLVLSSHFQKLEYLETEPNTRGMALGFGYYSFEAFFLAQTKDMKETERRTHSLTRGASKLIAR